MIIDARQGNNASMLFYLKIKRYVPEVQVTLTNIPDDKKDGNYEKEEWRKKLGLSRKMDINVVYR